MQIIVERTENPARSFWIWDEKITNKSEGRIYPSTTSNVGSGISVAVFQIDENENRTRIAQLELPDYEKLHEYYSTGKKINLDYTYIDDFSWLGEKKPYEVEGLSYTEREGFLARCSFFNNQGKESYLHLMQSIIKTDCLDFSYTAFFNLNLNLCNLTIEHGNVIFDHAHLYNSYISLSTIMCGGIQLFSPEISFRYISADNSKIDTMLMSQKLSIDFLCAQTINTIIELDSLPVAFKEICFTKATVKQVTITNAEIDSLDVLEACIDTLEFKRCKFLGYSNIDGNIGKLCINDSLNFSVFKLSLIETKELAFSNTVNNGKFCIQNFDVCIKAISNTMRSDTSSQFAEQLLMLKENFRQAGEYQNEDICHLLYQRIKTKTEKNIFKRVGRHFIDGISGYGTKPFRMLLVILVTIVLFGTLYYFAPFLSYHGAITWLDYVYTSGITFFAVGYGDLYPLNVVTKMVSLVEAFLGVTAMSYFLVLLSRKVIR